MIDDRSDRSSDLNAFVETIQANVRGLPTVPRSWTVGNNAAAVGILDSLNDCQ
jgi:hypothetical protein